MEGHHWEPGSPTAKELELPQYTVVVQTPLRGTRNATSLTQRGGTYDVTRQRLVLGKPNLHSSVHSAAMSAARNVSL